jgi:hypothetical protein
MLCTLIWDAYTDADRVSVWAAMRRLLPRNSRDWSRKGVYAFWDPDTRELLYVGLASNLPQRFAQHNELVTHSGGNKSKEINQWFSAHDRLGFTLLIQGAAVQILEDVHRMDWMLGAEAKGLTQIAEGQLIELHKQEHGHWPPWNGVGGSIQGSEWARPSERSVINLLSAADESLFVARRTLRELVEDRRALQMEALLHAARMNALQKLHGMDFQFGNDQHENIEKIMRVLLLIDGKLIDDLSPADDRIREGVARLTDPAAAAAERIEHLARIQDVAAGTTDDRDRAVAEYLAGYMTIDADVYNARLAADIIERGYLDEKPNLDVRD